MQQALVEGPRTAAGGEAVKRKRTPYRYRSAITGRYVSAEFAKRNPSSTVRERVTSKSFNWFCKGGA